MWGLVGESGAVVGGPLRAAYPGGRFSQWPSEQTGMQ